MTGPTYWLTELASPVVRANEYTMEIILPPSVFGSAEGSQTMKAKAQRKVSKLTFNALGMTVTIRSCNRIGSPYTSLCQHQRGNYRIAKHAWINTDQRPEQGSYSCTMMNFGTSAVSPAEVAR